MKTGNYNPHLSSNHPTTGKSITRYHSDHSIIQSAVFFLRQAFTLFTLVHIFHLHLCSIKTAKPATRFIYSRFMLYAGRLLQCSQKHVDRLHKCLQPFTYPALMFTKGCKWRAGCTVKTRYFKKTVFSRYLGVGGHSTFTSWK